MSKACPACPKGAAMALHLTPEYEDGNQAYRDGKKNNENPFDFFDDYAKCYAWDIGWQNARNREKEEEMNRH